MEISEQSGGGKNLNPQNIFNNLSIGKRNIIIIISVAVLIIAIALLGFFLQGGFKKPLPSFGPRDSAIEESTKGTLPSFSNNALDGKPNLNPVEKTNPVSEVKVNPFEK